MPPRLTSEESSKPQVAPGQELCRAIHDVLFGGFPRRADDAPIDIVGEVNSRLDYCGFAPASEERIGKATSYVREVQAKRQRDAALGAFRRAVGPRYEDCSLENFVTSHAMQKKVLSVLVAYASVVASRVQAGAGLIFFGPSGTGKDHLLVAVAKRAIDADVSVLWRNGRELFGRFRDAMDSDESEGGLLSPLMEPDVLAISDPLPPSGPLTSYQQDTLYRIVDARYRQRRAVWMTLNVRDGQEADDRIGVAIVDRLRHGAIAISCNWPTFRKPLSMDAI